MNWTAALLLAGFLQVSAAGYTQGKITLSLKKASLQKVFAAIKSQSGYAVWYDMAILKNTTPVNIKVKDVSLEEALAIACKDQPLEFHITDKMIVITTKMDRPGNDPPEKINVKGRVVNEKGEPVPGVSVNVKGTGIGTVSDMGGLFNLSNVNENAVLVFSGANIEEQELKLSGQKEIIIVAKTKVSKLDEIQIIGYGKTTKRYSTGNVSTVKSDIIDQQPVTNPLQSLEGRISGIQITQTSGLPGSAIRVLIRGQNSITASNNPLYIVDGVPFTSSPVEIIHGVNVTGNSNEFGSPLNSINPSDIESIEVLKDADATAVYGSRGSNGVILITTKKGQTGKPVFDFRIQSGVGSVSRMPKMLNTSQYIQVRKDGLASNNLAPNINNAPDLVLWDTTKNTDWQDWYMGGTTHQTNATATFSGGNTQTSFLISGTIHHETTVLPGTTKYQREGVHMNLQHITPNQKLKLEASLFYNTDNNHLNGPISSSLPQTQRIITSIPNLPIYDSLNNLYFPSVANNFVAQLQSNGKSQTDNMNGNLNLEYAIFTDLHTKISLGYNKIEVNQVNTNPASSYNPIYTTTGDAVFANQSIKTFIAEPQIEYIKKFNKVRLDFLLGGTIQKNNTTGQFYYANGYTSDLLLGSPSYGNIGYHGSNTTEYRYISQFGRLTLNWSNKYLLNGTLRRDGSTRFGPGKRFGNFGSIGTAWVFSNEKYLKALPLLSYGKFRASYGITGNDGIGDYGYLNLYSNTNNYGNTISIIPSQVENPNFGWEINRKFELAIELGIAHDRLLLTAAWFRNRSGNQLVDYPLPTMTGFSSYTANLPALVQNTGFELEANTSNIKARNFSWSTSLNLTIPKNKLISFPNLASSTYANSYVVGQPLSIIEGFHFFGVDSQTGLARVEDLNKDGVYTNSSSYNNQNGDYIIIGKTSPDWYGGLSNTLHYKSFQLSFIFQFVKQKGYNLYSFNYSKFGYLSNVWSIYLNYWRKSGDQASLPKPSYRYEPTNYQFQLSDAGITDASFIRVKNISFSYNFSQTLISRLKLSTLQLYVQAQNLWTITHYKGYDPEMAASSSIMIPTLRQITAGIQCSIK